MSNNIFTVASPALPPSAQVLCFRGTEGLSRPYRFAIGIQIGSDKEVDLLTPVGTRATLAVQLDGDVHPYQFHGVVAAFELVHEWQGQAAYRLLLVPTFWRTTLTKHSRVFIDQAIPEIIEQVLKSSGLSVADYELKLAGSYEPHDFVAQYKESNFAFISRWLEREGMYYFFEQGEQREKLVITDAKGFHPFQPGAPARYVPLTGDDDVMAQQAFDSFIGKHQAVPSKVELIDYDYCHPDVDVLGQADVAAGIGGEISLFGENIDTPAQGTRYARLRAEEILARRVLFAASGRMFHLRPGYKFTLEEHPRPAFNDGYLTTELLHDGNQGVSSKQLKQLFDIRYDDEYRCAATAIRADVQYRAKRSTPWPRIDGYEGAVVCGPATSEYSQIDEQGRYHVRVKFDESDLDDGTASAWVRMLQPHGGTTEGFHFPLRKNTEVLLFFQGGDPDQPVIAGVVPNMVTPSPVQTSNHTRNVIQTGGSNLIELEDQGGSQHIFTSTPVENTYVHLGAPKGVDHLELHTDGNAGFFYGGNWTVRVDGHQEETIEQTVDKTFNDTYSHQVVGDHTHKITEGNFDVDVESGWHKGHVKGWHDLHIEGWQKLTVDGYQEIIVGDYQKVTVTQQQDFKAKSRDIQVAEDVVENIGGAYYLDVTGGPFEETVTGLKKMHYGSLETLIDADVTITQQGGVFDIKHADDRKITFGSSISLFAGAKLTASVSAQVSLAASVSLGIKLGLDLKLALTASLAIRTADLNIGTFQWSQKALGVYVKGTDVKTAGPNIIVNAIMIVM
ncbi:MAG: type VI secretion system tip protein VgrG [Deltaproteobacteria bacterium]|nr:type VI secretion system tip protein VgrG [Deltaproteobacteria bacterium]